MKVEVIKQYSVFMPNKPGALSRLTKLFTDQNVNILGIASEVRDDSGLVRIAVDREQDASTILSKGGFSSVESNLLSVEAPDRPGTLRKIADALGDGKVNITTVYATALGGQVSRILIACENTDKARAILEGLG